MIVVFEMEHAILQAYKKMLLKKERRRFVQQACFFFTIGFS